MQQEMIYIHTIYQEGSFSKAAEKLFLSQSALSMAVQRVEEALGDAVFDRSKRPLKLTPVGHIYIQKYYEISRLEKEMQEEIRDLSELKGGSLTIGGTQYIFSYILAPVLLQYTTMYPDIVIQLVECSSNQLDDKLLDGSIDICLKCDDAKPPLAACGQAFRDNLFFVMPQSFISKYQLPDTALTRAVIVNNTFDIGLFPALPPAFWSRLPLLLLTSGNNLHTRTMQLYEEHQVIPNITLEIQQLVTAYQLAASGLGATLTTEFIINKNNPPDVVYYRLDSPLVTRDFQFFMNKKSYISKAAYRFMEMTRDYYQ